MLRTHACASRTGLVRLGRLVILGTLGWVAWLAWPDHAPRVVVIPVPPLPAPIVVLQTPPPSPAPPPAPQPAPDAVAPPVIGRTCPEDVTAIGLPFSAAHAGSGREIGDAAASETGCTIAAWSSDTIHVSWDGGQTFSTTDRQGIEHVAVGDGRIMALRHDRAIGTLTADAGWIWRAQPTLPSHSVRTLLAAGRYTVVLATRNADAEVQPQNRVDALIAFSSDDGAQWRYLPSPATGCPEITFDPRGRLVLVDTVTTYPEVAADEAGRAAPVRHKVSRYVTDLEHPAWRPFVASGWSYEVVADFTGDHFTTAHLTATRRGHSRVIWSDIHTHLESPTLQGRFGMVGGTLVRFAGPKVELLPGEQPPYDNHLCRVFGQDAYGTALVLNSGVVLRWSDRGGWRVLL